MALRRVAEHLCPPSAAPASATESSPSELPPVRRVPYLQTPYSTLLDPLQIPESQRVPIYDQGKVAAIAAAFDPAAWARDGYQVWPGIMLPEARQRWIEALQSVQRQNDQMIMHSWEDVDWSREVSHSGWTGALPATDSNAPGNPAVVTGEPPAWCGSTGEGLSDETRRSMLGGGQIANPLFAGTGVGSHHMNELRVPVGQGFLPECFPPSHSPFLMDVITHPQMLSIHRLLLGPQIRFDHSTLLNRLPTFKGQGWHSHSYAEDGKIGAPEPNELGLVRTVAYPDGFSANGDGGVRLVPGAHLFRATSITPGGTMDDRVFQREWLAEKLHPVTGGPLEILRPSVPPGSLVSFLCNMPHAVDRRALGRGTRWSVIMAYRQPDPKKRVPSNRHFPLQEWDIDLGIPGAEDLMHEW